MKKLIIVITLLSALIVTSYIFNGSKNNQQQNPLSKQISVLEGILREHPKYRYHYYIECDETAQKCTILNTQLVKNIQPGSYIKVKGNIKSFFDFNGAPDNLSNYAASWIYIDIDKITTLRQPENNHNQTDTSAITINSLNQLPIIKMDLTGDLGGRNISDLVKLQDIKNVIILNNGTSAPNELHLYTIESIIKENPEIQSFFYIDPDKGYRTRSYESEIHGFFTVLLQTDNDCIGFDLDGEKVRIFNGIGDGWIKR